MGESSSYTARRERPGIQTYGPSPQQQLPPAYSTISYDHETSMTVSSPIYIAETTCSQPNIDSQRRHTTTNFPTAQRPITSTSEKTPSASAHTMPRLPSARPSTFTPILTAQDVAQLLRPTSTLHAPFQRNQDGRRNTLHLHHRCTSNDAAIATRAVTNNDDSILSRSVDDLVSNAALVGESEAAADMLSDENETNAES